MLIPCSVLDFSKHAPDHLLGCSCAIWPTWQRSDSASTRYGFPDLDGWKTRNCRTSALGVYARGLAQLSLLPSTIDPNSMSINDILLNVQKLAAMVEGHYKTRDQRALHCRCRDAPQMPPPYEKLVETCALIERRRDGRRLFPGSGHLCLRCVKHQVSPSKDTACQTKHELGMESRPLPEMEDMGV
jgi:hypothetical protein